MINKSIRLGLLFVSINSAVLIFSLLYTFLYDWSPSAFIILIGYFVLMLCFISLIQACHRPLRVDEYYLGVLNFIAVVVMFFGSDYVGDRWIYQADDSVVVINLADPATLPLSEHQFIRLQQPRLLYDKIGRYEFETKLGTSNVTHILYALPVVSQTWQAEQPIELFIRLESAQQTLPDQQLLINSRQADNIEQAMANIGHQHQLIVADEPMLFEPSEYHSIEQHFSQISNNFIIFMTVLNSLLLVVTVIMRNGLFATPE